MLRAKCSKIRGVGQPSKPLGGDRRPCASGIGGDRAPGLVNVSISGRQAYSYAVLWPAGIGVRAAGGPHRVLMDRERAEVARRGTVCGFSQASRKRMQRLLVQLDWSAYPSTRCELTYGASGWQVDCATDSGCEVGTDGPHNWVLWKSQLAAFDKRLIRRWGSLLVGYVWKLEFGSRHYEQTGELKPHFHLVLFWRELPSISLLRVWFSNCWYEVVGSGDVRHLRAGTRVEAVYGTSGESVSRLMAYLSKYLGKRWEVSEPTGRIWGVKGELPTAQLGVVALDEAGHVELCRRIRRAGKRTSRYWRRITKRWRGFLLLGDYSLIGQLFRGLYFYEQGGSKGGCDVNASGKLAGGT